MGFSRQEYWSGLPFPSPGDLPSPGIKPESPALQGDSLPSEPPGKLGDAQLTQIPFSQAEWIKENFLEEMALEVGLEGSAGFFKTSTDNRPMCANHWTVHCQYRAWPCQEHHTQGLILKAVLERRGLFEPLSMWADSERSAWERLKAGGEGERDKIVGWHHQLNVHEFEQTPGDSEGQGSLECCSPWVAKSGTWLSNWTTIKQVAGAW